MNFAAFTFLDLNLLSTGLFAYVMMLACPFACAGKALGSDVARWPVGSIGCDAMAAGSAVTPSQAIYFHVATRHPETLRNTQHSAPRSASDVKHLLPPSGSFGVMQAGAVRGSGAGNPDQFTGLSSSADQTHAPTAQLAMAGMKVISGVYPRRISAALPYNTGTAVGHTAAVLNIFNRERRLWSVGQAKDHV